jgi:GTP-binding protein
VKVKQARFVLSAVERGDFVKDGLPQVAFVGRSNVGKSSLLNRLVGKKALARISSHPGKTRAVNYFAMDSSFYFVDLPGFGYAKAGRQERRAWAKLVDEYFRSTRPRPHVIQLVDAKVGATVLDVQAIEYLRQQGSPPTVVATKIDRLPRARRRRQLLDIQQALSLAEDEALLACSARTGEGVHELWKDIHTSLRSTTERAN